MQVRLLLLQHQLQVLRHRPRVLRPVPPPQQPATRLGWVLEASWVAWLHWWLFSARYECYDVLMSNGNGNERWMNGDEYFVRMISAEALIGRTTT